MQLCHDSQSPIYLLFVISKEVVITEISEVTTKHPARPYWVLMLTNPLMVQKWVKIHISSTAKFETYCKCSFSFNVFYNVSCTLPSCGLEAQTMPIKFFLRKDWIRAVLRMDAIIAKQLKEPNSPQRMKYFRITVAIIAPSDNLERGPLVLLGTGNCCVLFFLTS